mmetsp:Transcript_111560/g.266124  ORF Transcript_111560/g.266124 Transcript_111560/m.266124 type:complete len:225 (-) Transcript_111560:1062-1736(-)
MDRRFALKLPLKLPVIAQVPALNEDFTLAPALRPSIPERLLWEPKLFCSIVAQLGGARRVILHPVCLKDVGDRAANHRALSVALSHFSDPVAAPAGVLGPNLRRGVLIAGLHIGSPHLVAFRRVWWHRHHVSPALLRGVHPPAVVRRGAEDWNRIEPHRGCSGLSARTQLLHHTGICPSARHRRTGCEKGSPHGFKGIVAVVVCENQPSTAKCPALLLQLLFAV